LKIKGKNIDTTKKYKNPRVKAIRNWEKEHKKRFTNQQISEAWEIKHKNLLNKMAKMRRQAAGTSRRKKKKKSTHKEDAKDISMQILERVRDNDGKLGVLNFTLWWEGLYDLDLSAYFVGGECSKTDCQSVTTSDNGEICADCESKWKTQYTEKEKIYFGNTKSTYDGSEGELDIDANGPDVERAHPVENIVFEKSAPEGEYIVAVKLYSYKKTKAGIIAKKNKVLIPFKLLVSIGGKPEELWEATKGIQHEDTVAKFKVNYKEDCQR